MHANLESRTRPSLTPNPIIGRIGMSDGVPLSILVDRPVDAGGKLGLWPG